MTDDRQINEICLLSERAFFLHRGSAVGLYHSTPGDLLRSSTWLRSSPALARRIPYGDSEKKMRVRRERASHAHFTRVHESVPLRFTISPAILYLVTTKSSAMVFSVSSLSAMSSAHYNRNHVTPTAPPTIPLGSQFAVANTNRHHRHTKLHRDQCWSLF